MRFLRNKTLGEFKSDQRGLSSVEFGLIAPMFIFILYGVVAYFDAFRGNQTIARASTVAADLITRYQGQIDDADFAELVGVVEALAGEYATNSEFVLTFSSIRNPFDDDDSEDLEIAWSLSNTSGQQHTATDIEKFNAPDIPENETVILVTIDATYTPTLATPFFNSITLNSHHFRRPRFLDEIVCVSENGNC